MKILSPKINNINYVKLSPSNKPAFKGDDKPERASCIPLYLYQSLEIKAKQEDINKVFNDFINKKGKVTKEEYFDIVKKHPSIIELAKKYCEQEYFMGQVKPGEIACLAMRSHEFLKKNFENYRIISVGTSPSILTEQMQALGDEVISIPVSGIGMKKDKDTNLFDFPNMLYILDYLKEKNINDGKTNIILDYAVSGRTMHTIARFLREYNDIPDENVQTISLRGLLSNALEGKPWQESPCKDMFLDDVHYSNIVFLSNTPHFCVNPSAEEIYNTKDFTISADNLDQKDFNREVEEASRPLARAYSLVTMHNLFNMLKRGENKDTGYSPYFNTYE